MIRCLYPLLLKKCGLQMFTIMNVVGNIIPDNRFQHYKTVLIKLAHTIYKGFGLGMSN